MNLSREATLALEFERLNDTELLARLASGLLADDAHPVAVAEATRRGLDVPAPSVVPEDDALYEGDYAIVARDLDPTEAHLLRECLRVAGIAAEASDSHLVQASQLWSIALGGARVRVPSARLADAREVIAAYRRGDFALDDGFDGGTASGGDAPRGD